MPSFSPECSLKVIDVVTMFRRALLAAATACVFSFSGANADLSKEQIIEVEKFLKSKGLTDREPKGRLTAGLARRSMTFLRSVGKDATLFPAEDLFRHIMLSRLGASKPVEKLSVLSKLREPFEVRGELLADGQSRKIVISNGFAGPRVMRGDLNCEELSPLIYVKGESGRFLLRGGGPGCERGILTIRDGSQADSFQLEFRRFANEDPIATGTARIASVGHHRANTQGAEALRPQGEWHGAALCGKTALVPASWKQNARAADGTWQGVYDVYGQKVPLGLQAAGAGVFATRYEPGKAGEILAKNAYLKASHHLQPFLYFAGGKRCHAGIVFRFQKIATLGARYGAAETQAQFCKKVVHLWLNQAAIRLAAMKEVKSPIWRPADVLHRALFSADNFTRLFGSDVRLIEWQTFETILRQALTCVLSDRVIPQEVITDRKSLRELRKTLFDFAISDTRRLNFRIHYDQARNAAARSFDFKSGNPLKNWKAAFSGIDDFDAMARLQQNMLDRVTADHDPLFVAKDLIALENVVAKAKQTAFNAKVLRRSRLTTEIPEFSISNAARDYVLENCSKALLLMNSRSGEAIIAILASRTKREGNWCVADNGIVRLKFTVADVTSPKCSSSGALRSCNVKISWACQSEMSKGFADVPALPSSILCAAVTAVPIASQALYSLGKTGQWSVTGLSW